MDQGRSGIVRTACIDLLTCDDPAASVAVNLGDDDFAFVIVLVSPCGDLEAIAKKIGDSIAAEHIIGARTAGEIGYEGYCEDCLVVLGFPKSHFVISPWLIEHIDVLDDLEIGRQILVHRQEAQSRRPEFGNSFAFLLVDGLSQQEDTLVAVISMALGATPLFGGSSGDGLRFHAAPLYYNGALYNNAAILLIVQTNFGVRTFCENHFVPTDKKLVVTGAIPEHRLVTEINAEPAAQEYARVVGISPSQLSPFVFASHPVLVSVGSQHHVRAIQKIEDNKNLKFFSSVDEGMVLTVAHAQNIAQHLEQVLGALDEPQAPDVTFACDCILRRLEAEQKQQRPRMSEMFKRHRVLGFSTYGEQYNMLHLNQTLTGISLYRPNND